MCHIIHLLAVREDERVARRGRAARAVRGAAYERHGRERQRRERRREGRVAELDEGGGASVRHSRGDESRSLHATSCHVIADLGPRCWAAVAGCRPCWAAPPRRAASSARGGSRAPRRERWGGVRVAVTLAIESRDPRAPRHLRAPRRARGRTRTPTAPSRPSAVTQRVVKR